MRWNSRFGSPFALALGFASNVYSALRNRTALVMQASGLLILAPGSIGYRSLAALLQSNTLMGVQAGFQMVLVGAALVNGLLFANLISPDRDLLRILGRGALGAGMRVRSLYSPTRPRM